MTKILTSINEWRQLRKTFPHEQSIGFVPTMGNLHPGHFSLLKKSRAENMISVLSIFINPTQFNDKNDFEKYPKTIEDDLRLAKEAGVDYVLLPQEKDIYPEGYRFKISENQISQILEGKHRPGHFDGVLTVVMKLLSLVKPHRAYFGEKDYQQFQLIKDMCASFFMDIDIIPCPTVRLPSGLAMSSRNNLLNAAQLKQSELFSYYLKSGESEATIKSHLERAGFKVEYIEKWHNRLYGAVKIGDVRLIDNILIEALDLSTHDTMALG